LTLLSGALTGQQLKTVKQIEGIPPKVEYRAIAHDDDGNLYVATSADVFLIASNSYQAQPLGVGDQVVDVDWHRDYGLIMLYRNGEIHFTSSGKVITVEADAGATCMDVTRSMIWVGTKNGVSTVSIAQERVVDHYTTEDGILLSNEINFIHSDNYGVRWIGSNAGVIRIAGNDKWKLYEKDQAITAITQTSEGAWIAADSSMWLVDNYNRWYTIDAWKDLVEGKVKALSSDGKGLIYIASNILVKYDPYEEEIVSMNEGGTSDQMILLSQDKGKNVWMAGSNGLAKVIEDTATVLVPESKGDRLAAVINVKSTPVCPGMNTGHMIVDVAGGTPPYTYAWGGLDSDSREVTGLKAGLYQVTVTDQEGKTILASGIIPSSPELTVMATTGTKASDKLAADGVSVAKVEGGIAPYQYKWSNGETADRAVKLPEGEHTLTVIDANGCLASATFNMEADKVLKSLDIATISLGQTIQVEKLYFAADSTKMEPASFAVLEEIYDFLITNPNVKIEIGGHTNSLPEDAYCDRLSTDRAENVAAYLYDKGIPKAQISAKGYGKRQPIATNRTVDGRRKNQRVEIKVVSL
jgi:outer membrane protein OmpA-like peptidoglycan-associated protein/ligand-binding sensor domain-containing protein